jgi:hypothetical protein
MVEHFMTELRLGDIIDDFCVKCRRLTNHAIVSLVDGKAAKVRCRTCYNDHDYRHEIAPPTKKELKKQELFNAVLANGGIAVDGQGAAPAATAEAPAELAPAEVAEVLIPAEVVPVEAVAPPVKKARGRAKRA